MKANPQRRIDYRFKKLVESVAKFIAKGETDRAKVHDAALKYAAEVMSGRKEGDHEQG